MKNCIRVLLILVPLIIQGCVSKQAEKDDVIINHDPWSYIQKHITLYIPNNFRIEQEKQKILDAKSSFQYTLLNAEPYIYYIIHQLKARNMPIELALIPLIESAYNPLATSNANAAGLWQIAPITAKEYKLTSNFWYDSRRDLIESTNAALDFLQKLNRRYKGDWLLTLAAYNTGTVRINQAMAWNISKGLPTHYWALNLTKETMEYVPKFLAIAELIRHFDQYNVNLPKLEIDNALMSFSLSRFIKLETISKYADVPLEDLKKYNAAHVKALIREEHAVFIPITKAQTFQESLKKQTKIEAKPVSLLFESDKKIKQTMTYPLNVTSTKYAYIDDKLLNVYQQTHQKYNKITYYVKSGDNLITIAKKFKVKVPDIIEWNKIQDKDKLRLGQRLVLHVKNYQ